MLFFVFKDFFFNFNYVYVGEVCTLRSQMLNSSKLELQHS